MRGFVTILLALGVGLLTLLVAFAFAATLERMGGGCGGFFGWCDHPITLTVSAAIGVIAALFVLWLRMR